MAIQKREVEVAKEIDDCMVLVANLFRDIKSGKSASEIALGNIPALMEAVSGVDQVKAEIEGSRKVALQTIGFRTGELTDALLG